MITRTCKTIRGRKEFALTVSGTGIVIDLSAGGPRHFSKQEIDQFLQHFAHQDWFELNNSTTQNPPPSAGVGAYYAANLGGSMANASRFVAALVDERYLAFDLQGHAVKLKVIRDTFQ